MNKFMADVRNPALALCGLAIIVLGAQALLMKRQDPGVSLAEVGTKALTRGEFTTRLQERRGDDELLAWVNRQLIEQLAAKQQYRASKEEVGQVVRFYAARAELYGRSAEALLRAQGFSTSSKGSLAEDIGARILQVKMAVPKEDRQQMVAGLAKAGAFPYALPVRYRYFELSFDEEAKAKQAAAEIAALPAGGLTQDAIGEMATHIGALNYATAREVRLHAPGLMEASDEASQRALAALKPGQVSGPMSVPGGGKGWRRIIALIEKQPAVKPTLENCEFVVGGAMLDGEALLERRDTKYQAKAQELLAEALQLYPVRFTTDEFAEARDTFDKFREEHPVIAAPSAE